MTFFLFVFFLVYGLMHAYFAAKVRAAYPGFTPYALLVFPVLVLTPLVVRVLERNGFDLAARGLSWAGYSWMGFLFLFIVAALILDAGRVLAAGLRLITGRTFSFPSPGKTLAVALVAAAGIFIYGLYENHNIRTERIFLKSAKIPREARIKIVQISDVHLGLIVGEKKLEKILDRIKEENPDLIVSTGDLLDGQADLDNTAELLNRIRPEYGKIAVFGNHEYYSGFDRAREFHAKAGFDLLRGEKKQVCDFLQITGLDDPAAAGFGLYRRMPPENNPDAHADRFVLLLRHRPVFDGESGRFDLQLSGHTHGGQIFPFGLVTRIFFDNMDRGFHRLSPKERLYVSRGSGTWGPPIRFLTPPEVTVIEMTSE
ncbi:MAG: metallophosphoesterase [Syntrophales bacterium]|nr:metallophosphoesterase [Syntrophales bacterium]MDD5232968.1 metallophosphoesterase [Syntrophales bacterium]MDD5532413.1 metallophosphoesterase [Syntrophales bacterium]HPL62251.1 metallophosphoesterase [Syntrophales bacterium]